MSAQHSRAPLTGLILHRLNAQQRTVRLLRIRTHRRRHKRRNAGFQQALAHSAHVRLAAHAVRTRIGMDMDIDKARQNEQPCRVANLFTRLGAQLADFSNFSRFNAHIDAHKAAVDERRSVLNQHG